MRLSKITRAVNLRYAVGELVIIVVGILIALAISNWNDRRMQREHELLLLDEIRSGLQVDIVTLQDNLEHWTGISRQIEDLIDILKEKPAYHSGLDQLFGAAYGIKPTNLNTATYDALKSIGLQMVTSRELRAGISRVFDYHYESLAIVNDVDSTVTFNVLRPYYLTHFRDLEFQRSATPMDYGALVKDAYFENIIDYRLTVIRSNQTSLIPLAIEDIRKVLKLLDEELGS